LVLLMNIENEILEVKHMGKVAIITLSSEGPFLKDLEECGEV